MKIVVIEKAVELGDGSHHLIRTPFEVLPDWAKDLVRPRWDHPGDCECADCWQVKEGPPSAGR